MHGSLPRAKCDSLVDEPPIGTTWYLSCDMAIIPRAPPPPCALCHRAFLATRMLLPSNRYALCHVFTPRTKRTIPILPTLSWLVSGQFYQYPHRYFTGTLAKMKYDNPSTSEVALNNMARTALQQNSTSANITTIINVPHCWHILRKKQS